MHIGLYAIGIDRKKSINFARKVRKKTIKVMTFRDVRRRFFNVLAGFDQVPETKFLRRKKKGLIEYKRFFKVSKTFFLFAFFEQVKSIMKVTKWMFWKFTNLVTEHMTVRLHFGGFRVITLKETKMLKFKRAWHDFKFTLPDRFRDCFMNTKRPIDFWDIAKQADIIGIANRTVWHEICELENIGIERFV